MFDIGAWEIMVIGVMALVILGPERLPSAIKSTISTVRSIKQMANGFKQEVVSQLDVHELHENLKKAESLGMKNIGGDLQKSVDELKAAAASVQEPYKKSSPNPEFVGNKQYHNHQEQRVAEAREKVNKQDEPVRIESNEQSPSQAELFSENDIAQSQTVKTTPIESNDGSEQKTVRRPIDE